MHSFATTRQETNMQMRTHHNAPVVGRMWTSDLTRAFEFAAEQARIGWFVTLRVGSDEICVVTSF
jgi:hypothetical protein